jgi:GT2 family glycosyltransferase
LDGLTPTSFRIKRQIIGNPKVSIIIPTHNGRDLVKACIESIERKTQGVDYEVIVVDNNSNETKSLEYLKQVEKRHLVLKYQKPFNFSAINNFAVQYASGEHILFLNNDIEVINEKWLESLLEYSQLPEIGAVGCKLIYPNNTIQHAGVILGIGGVAGHSHKGFPKDASGYMDRIQIAQNITAVTGACLMIKKALFEEVGGFNEKDLAVAFNDVELCIKLYDKGYRNIYTPFAQLYHYESVSRGNEDTPEKMARFEREAKYMIKNWSKYLNRDPNYNPNLTHVRENFGLNIE